MRPDSGMLGRVTAALLLAAAMLASGHAAAASETLIPRAADLARDVRDAQKAKLPVAILFSLPGCPHCEAIRRAHLKPLSEEKPPRALVRQVDLGGADKLIGFDGKPTTHATFATAQGMKFAPVVAFFTPKGKRIGEPLIGAMLPDFYASYLEDGLAAARAAAANAGQGGRKSP